MGTLTNPNLDPAAVTPFNQENFDAVFNIVSEEVNSVRDWSTRNVTVNLGPRIAADTPREKSALICLQLID